MGTDSINADEIKSLVDAALAEDHAADDVTVRFLKIGNRPVVARLIAGEDGLLAGLEVARLAFMRVGPDNQFAASVKDGEPIQAGQVVAEIRGVSADVLPAERVALNFLQHLSGVATLTGKFVAAVEGTGLTILDTRKTTPLYRALEKYSVRMGGGKNHRFHLGDMILIKENHLRSVGGVSGLRELLANGDFTDPIEVEVDSLELLNEILGARIQRIMLDNFSPAEVSKAVALIESFGADNPGLGTPEVEVSGGITLDTVREYAIPGVHYLSVGALTHSAPALPFSLEVATDGE